MNIKERKIKFQKKVNDLFTSFIVAFSIMFLIFGIARIFGAKLGARMTNNQFLQQFGSILSKEQEFLAKEQIYSSGYDKIFLIAILGFALISLLLICLNINSLKKNEKSAGNFFTKYFPEVIVAGSFGSLIVALAVSYSKIGQDYSTFMLDKFSVQAELLNLSQEQIDQINKAIEKQGNMQKIFIPIIAFCLLAAMIGILIYMNSGPDRKIEVDNANMRDTASIDTSTDTIDR